MTSYSIPGYAVALLLRSKKTILVEGVSDANLVRHFFTKKNMSNDRPKSCLVDDIGIIKDDSLFGLGCRAKVEVVATRVGASEKLNWLYDREWDGVDFEKYTIVADSEPPNGKGYKTLGHSIENYWMREDILKDYLLMTLGATMPHAFFEEFSSRFHQMMLLAVAFSLAARRFSAITRCSGLLQSDDLIWVDGKYNLNSNFDGKLLARGCASNFFEEVQVHLNHEELNMKTTYDLQLIAHGHLGEDVLRCCCAHLAKSYGADSKIRESIERGKKNEKVAHHTHQLTNNNCGLYPIDRLYSWSS